MHDTDSQPEVKTVTLSSVHDLVQSVLTDFKGWKKAGAERKPAQQVMAWFRGEPKHTPAPLCPELFREYKYWGRENELLQSFRSRAPILGTEVHDLPQRKETDQWLYLAQHSRLPTRLLDWTEGLLIALYFALDDADKYCCDPRCPMCPSFDGQTRDGAQPGRNQSESTKSRQPKGAVVWMLNPLELNRLALGSYSSELPLPWFSGERQPPTREEVLKWVRGGRAALKAEWKKLMAARNLAHDNIRRAWEQQQEQLGTDLPVAFRPTHIHARMSSQLSCFTVWGREKEQQIREDAAKKGLAWISTDNHSPKRDGDSGSSQSGLGIRITRADRESTP